MKRSHRRTMLAAGSPAAVGRPRLVIGLFPDKQQNQKHTHPIGCTLRMRMLRFLRPEKFCSH